MVEQAAAYGVDGEQDVRVDIVLADQHAIGESIGSYLRDRVALFMLPRYIEFRSELPMTGSQRVEKYKLRAAELTGVDHDRGPGGTRTGRDITTCR